MFGGLSACVSSSTDAAASTVCLYDGGVVYWSSSQKGAVALYFVRRPALLHQGASSSGCNDVGHERF
jgi:hypothetical protein